MQGFKTRIKLWDKEKKFMLPSVPLYKCDFYNVDTSKYIPLFSTGLKDKKGTEIYDGDIVKLRLCSQNLIRKVRQSYSGAWCIDVPAMGDSNINGASMLISSLKFELIGNIHENPELTTDI